eukprot:scaffold389015_cov22-Prasinocladus_malaysianus.AAC.1
MMFYQYGSASVSNAYEYSATELDQHAQSTEHQRFCHPLQEIKAGEFLLFENNGLRVQGVNPNVLTVCTEVPQEMDADFITEQLAKMEVRPAHCLRFMGSLEYVPSKMYACIISAWPPAEPVGGQRDQAIALFIS